MRFLSVGHAVQNALQLVRARTGAWPAPENLPASLAMAISEMQGTQLSLEGSTRLSFEDNPIGHYAAQQALFAGEGQRIGDPLTNEERLSVERNVEHARMLVRHLDPALGELMDLIVADIVCVRVHGSGGGTASNFLGMIWLSPHPRWTTIDYAECIVHEMVHLSVFLGDAVNRLYIDARRVHEPSAQVISAVRQEPRDLDKSLHSACVAVALAYFYDLLGDRTTSQSFLPPLERCVVGLLAAGPQYLTEYGMGVVRELDAFVTTGGFDDVGAVAGGSLPTLDGEFEGTLAVQ